MAVSTSVLSELIGSQLHLWIHLQLHVHPT